MDEMWRWVAGGLAAAGGLAYSELRMRMTRMEDMMSAQRRADTEDAGKSRDKIWQAVEATRKEVSDLQKHVYQNLVTKDDIRETEDRLLRAFEKGSSNVHANR